MMYIIYKLWFPQDRRIFMWTRKDLKSTAKAVLKNCYWECVAAYLIVNGIVIVASLIGMQIPFASFASILFLSAPLSVGVCYFYIQNRYAPTELKNIFYSFERTRYMKIVGKMAWMYLFIYLWSLIPSAGMAVLLVKLVANGFAHYFNGYTSLSYFGDLPYDIPNDIFAGLTWQFLLACGVLFIAGMIVVVIKTISYSMTPYILTDNPYIRYERALRLSIEMTQGQKWRIFVLGLSFIGWGILAVITFGIGMIFLTPYLTATYTELYLKLRDNAISSGICTAAELNLYR
jgi:uncharacterized membrane protein